MERLHSGVPGRARTAAPLDDTAVPRRARRTVALPPDPESPGRARVVLRQTLRDGDRLDCLDAAELACTELVTNAVLHAHTTVVVTVEVATDVRVEVRDAGAALPHRSHHDSHATTGRGLALVAALTDAHGVADVGPEGKTVWFTLGGGNRSRTEDELLEAWDAGDWDLEDPDLPVRAGSSSRPVRLLGVPTALWLAASQHHDALLRELVLYIARHDDVEVDVVGTDRARFVLSAGVAAAAAEDRRARAAAHGADRPTGTPAGRTAATTGAPAGPARPDARTLPSTPRPVDLELAVPAELARDFGTMQDTLDVAEDLARAGRLLTHPGLPEIIAVRDWACEQVVAQLAGIGPTPWSGTSGGVSGGVSGGLSGGVSGDAPSGTAFRPAPPRHRSGRRQGTEPERAIPKDAPEGLDVAAVAASPRAVAAADESNRLVAVSEPLARLLGWRAEQLVGLRIVALVPHRLRDAHVAGFTRHQSTGETRVLGVPLTVPVLRADGTEVSCALLIEQVPLPSGRGAYLAWFDADDGPPAG